MRTVHADTAVALAGETLQPIGMVELEFDSGFMRMWTGLGDIAWNGHTWNGVGTLGQIGSIEETTEIRAVGMTLQLSGIPAEVLEIANEEDWQGRSAKVYYAVLQGRSFVGEPLKIFDGLMDQMTLVEGEQATIQLTCESKQIDLERTLARRWTAEEHRSAYPGDRGLDQVAALQELEIMWGRG